MSNHCWHVVPGFAYANGAYRYVCCYCGEMANGSAGYRDDRPPGHGPHAPLRRQQYIDGPAETPCPARERGAVGEG